MRVVDNVSSGKIENLQRHLESIEFIEGDLLDPDAVAAALAAMIVMVVLSEPLQVFLRAFWFDVWHTVLRQ